jgi:crossover junction endodeoxyribonuclease RuvC
MKNGSKYRVLGIDPGLNITGYGAVDFLSGDRVVIAEAGAIRTDAGADTETRVEQIFDDLTKIIDELKPDRIAVEKLYAHYNHPRTAIIMGHARGVILLAARKAGIGVRSVPSTKVKKSMTGNGHASKRQIQLAVKAMFDLDEIPEPPDVADAVAIAVCAGRMT